MTGTIPAIEPGSVMIDPEHVRELRALLVEVRKQRELRALLVEDRKQQYAPATCGHNNSAAVELAGYLRALLGPEPRLPRPRGHEAAVPRPRLGS